MKRRAFILMLVTGNAVAGQKIDVKFDRSDDLSRFRSFTWSKDQKPVDNMANHIRIVNAVQKRMMELGYRIDTRTPDVLVQYTLERHTAVQTRSTQQPSVWDPTDLTVKIDVSKEEQVSLKVELKEAESNFLVWEARGTYPLGTPDRSERQIHAAVEDLFSKYPKPDDKKN